MFCIITPVFDEAFAAVPGLLQDLKDQTYKNFKHILISNGASPIIKNIVIAANDDRFIYVETPYEETPKLETILVNIAKRRNYAIENFKSERYFFFDADLLVYAHNFLDVVAGVHDKADVILSKILFKGLIELPIFPIVKGKIDIANYSFSRKMAEKYKYSTCYNLKNGIANDWAFYEQMKDESHYFNDMCYAKKDGRALYRNLSTRYTSERMRGTL